MRHARWTWLFVSTVSLIAVSTAAPAQNYSFHPEPLQPRIEAGAKAGTERSMGTMEGWMPIVQDDDSVLYGDIRWMADDEDNQEGNLGLGYRAMQGDHIVGVHGWIDRRRTDRGSNFHQITGGVEFMKEDWDIKANAYVPLNKQKEYTTANLGSDTPYMAGTGLFVDTNGVVIEEAQPGGDIEVGYRIPAFEKNIDAIRVYGGGYAFIGDQSDDTIGGRVRASIDINPLINVGARFQYDEPRGSQGFIEATLRFPFKAKKRFQEHGLRARLDESPERDIDIVTGAQVDNGLRKEVINTESGVTQRVIHVDNTAANGGNGSKENPYNTLAAAQAAMLDNDVIYIHAGNGTTSGMDQGITINKNNVQLIGSGTDFVFDTDKFTTRRPGQKPADGTLIAAGGAAPVIKNISAAPTSQYGDQVNGNGIFITAANASVSGVTLDGSLGSGIQILVDGAQNFGSYTITDVTALNNYRGFNIHATNGATIDNVLVSDNHITNSTQWGILTSSLTGSHIGNVTFQNNISNNNIQQGAVITADDVGSTIGTASVEGNTFNGNTGFGLWLRAKSGQIDAATLDNNTLSSNQQSGIAVDVRDIGTITEIDITNNTGNSNLNNGVTFVAAGSSNHIHATTIENNTFNGNTQSGIIFAPASTQIDALLIKNNTTNSNGQYGVYTLATTGTTITSNIIENNTANTNVRAGIFVQSAGTGNMNSAIIRNNIANTNGWHGGFIFSQGTSNMAASLSGNTFTGNGTAGGSSYYGLYIDTDSTGTFNIDVGGGSLGSTGGNRIYSNVYRDVYVDSRPGTAAATPGTTISATGNWWGVNTGLNQGTRATFDNGSASPGSSINASGYLTVDPGI